MAAGSIRKGFSRHHKNAAAGETSAAVHF